MLPIFQYPLFPTKKKIKNLSKSPKPLPTQIQPSQPPRIDVLIFNGWKITISTDDCNNAGTPRPSSGDGQNGDIGGTLTARMLRGWFLRRYHQNYLNATKNTFEYHGKCINDIKWHQHRPQTVQVNQVNQITLPTTLPFGSFCDAQSMKSILKKFWPQGIHVYLKVYLCTLKTYFLYFESIMLYFQSIFLYFQSILVYLVRIPLYFRNIVLYFESIPV